MEHGLYPPLAEGGDMHIDRTMPCWRRYVERLPSLGRYGASERKFEDSWAARPVQFQSVPVSSVVNVATSSSTLG